VVSDNMNCGCPPYQKGGKPKREAKEGKKEETITIENVPIQREESKERGSKTWVT
jgi:hypothetical protein